MSHACPICETLLEPNPRYPRYVCQDCAARATSADGRSLAFFNTDIWGGFGARYTDTEAPYDSHNCWIDGVPCHADEARFGGIVIETLEGGDRAGER